MNDPRYNAVPNPAYATECHWCNYCNGMTDHLSSGHPEPKPRLVDPNTMALNIMATKVAAIREFAEGIIAYEEEHAAGADTPLRLAFASDILAILEGQ